MFNLKKLILKIVVALFLISIAFVPFGWAEEEWQTITAYGITLSLPSEWKQLEENLGFSEKESNWYNGDLDKPEQFLILARGENVDLFLEMFIENEAEELELIQDTSRSIGGMEARMVTLGNPQNDDKVIFIAVDKIFKDGEGLFMNITFQGNTSEEFQPILEKILDSIAFDINEIQS